jgi:protoporphyrinogen oxidase
VDYLIVGAGPTGLGAALHLQRLSADWALLEAQTSFGGLAFSWIDAAGFTWDFGAHVEYSHYQEFDNWMLATLGAEGWITQPRKSWIVMGDRKIPYPLQKNFHRLDPRTRWEIVDGFLTAQEVNMTRRPEHYDEWVSATLGEPFNALFMRPFIAKVWGYPAEMLDYQWVDERVAVPTVRDVLRSICLDEDHDTWGSNQTFRYPAKGGIGTIWNSLGQSLPSDRIQFGKRVVKLDVHNRCVICNDGTVCGYERLISTIPLDELIACMPDVVDQSIAAKLLYSATHVVGVGLQGSLPSHLKGASWLYFPNPGSPYHRVSIPSNYSPHNVPEPGNQWSLLAEITGSPLKPVNLTTLVDDSLDAMVRDGFLPNRSSVISISTRSSTHGYPTPFLGRDKVVPPLLESLESLGIYSRGRFGAWKYEVSNQDHSFMQGVEVAEYLLTGKPEETLPYPRRINARLDNPSAYLSIGIPEHIYTYRQPVSSTTRP